MNLARHASPRRRALPLTAGLCVLLALLGGCGYQNSSADPDAGYQWRSLYREDIRSVAVPIFHNRSFERGVEFSLTKAVAQRIEATTPYKVIPQERADTLLEGEIVAVDTDTVSSDFSTATPQEQLLRVQVNFVWKDLRNGQIITHRRAFEQAVTYYPTLGEGRFHGSQQAIESLAAGIVRELQADW